MIVPKKTPKQYPFVTITQGSIFGEVDILFFNERRKYTFTAVTPLELMVLSKKDFKRIFWLDFREVGHEVFREAQKKSKVFKLKYNKRLNELKNNGDQELMDKDNSPNSSKEVLFLGIKN